MTNANLAFRALVTYGLVLPLALILGYFMATPNDMSTWALVGTVLLVLSTPLFLRWHYPLLFLAWNMTAVVFFLPGRPQLWVIAVAFSFVISVVQRALLRNMRWVYAP